MSNTKNLIFDSRFWPTFWTQFLGAFNDNVFKNALVILITYQSYSLGGIGPAQMVAFCGGIFILPFFLFSALSGQICDKYPKDKLVVIIKVWEILVMAIGAYGFISENILLLVITLFMMGLQSTVFGPVKYSILPEIITDDELVQGNALFSMGTFISILLGTILGGVLIGMGPTGKYWVSGAVILFAVFGTFFGTKIAPLRARNPKLEINLGLFKNISKIMKITSKSKNIFLAVLGISWFWFLGAALLSIFPVYAKDTLGGNEYVATLFLAIFSIGIAIGSMGCSRMSRKRLELGLVPFGSLGISLFVFDLFLVGSPELQKDTIVGIAEFLQSGINLRIIFDLLMISVFSGFFFVPLYTYIQQKAEDGERSQVIAGLNIINALFMVLSAVMLMLLYQLNLSVPQIFGLLALLNFLMGIYIIHVMPEFLIRFCAMILTRFMYRLKVTGHENIPEDGACLITCNHMSFIDWMVVAGAIKRPVRYVIYYKFVQIPGLRYFFKLAKVIPIAGKYENEAILKSAMDEIEAGLRRGDVVCIFPEGEITHDGELGEFKKGLEIMLKRCPVPVVPTVIKGFWGSFFSRKHGKRALSKPSVIPRQIFQKVEMEIFPLWKPEDVTSKKLEEYTREKLSE